MGRSPEKEYHQTVWDSGFGSRQSHNHTEQRGLYSERVYR